MDGTDTTTYVNQYLEVRPEGDTYYIFNGSTRIASVKDSTVTYYSQDHLGGTALATNSSGTVVEVDDYYPYGDSLASIDAGETAPVHHTFTDKEFDDSLGLFYFEARWYNPTIGRFVSEDPMQYEGVNASKQALKLLVDPQSLNFYSYTRDNPVNLTDPTGKDWQKNLVTAAASVGIAVMIIDGVAEIMGGIETLATLSTALANSDLPAADDIASQATTMSEEVSSELTTLTQEATGGTEGGSDVKFNVESKIEDQMGKRGWTQDQIKETINNPTKTVETTDIRYNNDGSRLNEPATGYVNSDGSYVVRNNQNGNIVQISDKNDSNWKAPFNTK